MVRDDEWLIAAAGVVAIEIAFGAILSLSLHYYLPPPWILYTFRALPLLFIGSIYLVFYGLFKLWRQRADNPGRALIKLAYTERRQLVVGILAFFLAVVQLTVLTWNKVFLFHVTDFWADPYLANFDLMLFRTDPWRLTHMLPVGHTIDRLYMMWFPWLSIVFGVNLMRKPGLPKAQAGLSFFLIMGVLGVCSIFVLPSAGPIFFERVGYGTHYAQLTQSLEPFAKMGADYLWEKHLGHIADFASGISAMPSMHVAMASWTALTMQSMSRKIAPLGWMFWAFIYFGSVYLGWHYAADGIVGSLGAIALWRATGAVLRRRAAAHVDAPNLAPSF